MAAEAAFASFSAFCLATILVVVGAQALVREGHSQEGKWIGTPWRQLGRLKSSSVSALLVVMGLTVKAAVDTLGAVITPHFSRIEATSTMRDRGIMTEGSRGSRGLNRTCFGERVLGAMETGLWVLCMR